MDEEEKIETQEEQSEIEKTAVEEETPAEESAEEAPIEETANDEVLEQKLEQEGRLPFPNARVVALLKEGLDSEKMIRSRVKLELNEFLGKMVKQIANELNKSPYTMVEAGDLHRAIKKYEQLEEVHKQKERILVYLEKIKQDCNVLMADVERSFDVS